MMSYMWIIIFCVFITLSEAYNCRKSDRDFDSIWTLFKKEYHKRYCRREEHRRRGIWNKSLYRITKHNLEWDLGKHRFRRGLNKYSDLGVCGSCWAFSAVASLEGQIKKKTGEDIDLSEQNLVDCSSSYGNNGCQGGWMTQAFDYIIDNGGIEDENTYPYRAREGQCRFRKSNIVATCRDYEEIESGNEEALQEALVTVGPISVGIDASLESFQDYKNGIYDDPSCSSENIDHAVLAVGYGTEDGVDYWIIKNSYGTSWGENGYARIARNNNNQCGIATQASYPIV